MDALCACCLSFIANHTVLPVFRHCGYVIKYKSNISDLDAQIQKLEDRRVAVNCQVVAAEENLETVLSEVESWLSEVEAVIEKRAMIFEERNVSKAWCCYGWCLNPKACHYFGRKAKKMALRIKELQSTGNFTTVGFIYEIPQRSHEAGTSSGASLAVALESRASVFRNVLEALKGDDSSPVIVFGMSGIGKTTMLNEIYKSKEASFLFDKVLLVEVSREEDYLFKLQTDIASSIGLKRMSDHTNLVERANLLSKGLMSRKVLVMLDDVREDIDIEKAGIPPCKVLISTRFQHLDKVSTERKFTISCLTQEEAWSLFKKMAGDGIESTELKSTAEKIVKKCDGLPIAISIIGRTLFKEEDKGIWEDVLRRLDNPSSENVLADKVVDNMLPKIQVSFNLLRTEEAQSFFFLCCIYPEGSAIQVEDLVRHGLGLGIFENIRSMVEGRNCVKALIRKLKCLSLLLDSNKKGCVKMHDLVRKTALQLDSSMSDRKNKITVTCKSDYFEYHEVSGRMENLILLSRSDDSKQQGEVAIKVLDCKQKFPGPQILLPGLETIQTLCLEHCNLNDVSKIGELKMLTILNLRHSSMNELPQSFKNLSNLWLLDLTGCRIRNHKLISSGIISGLNKLQELYMLGVVVRSREEFIPHKWHEFEEPDKFEKPDEVVSELLSWQCSLTTFEADLPEVNLKSLQGIRSFDKLKRFKISIGCSDRWDMVPSHYNCLRLNVDADPFVGSALTKLLQKTQTLEIAMNICFRGLICKKIEGGKTLNDILCIIPDCIFANLFPVLRSITINSSEIWTSYCICQNSKEIFHELRRVELHYCPSLSYLFTTSVDKGDHLHQLEELDVRACSELKEIIVASEGEIQDSNWICELPNLIKLELVDLKNFVRISRVSMCFPLLINIKLEKLPKLVTLYPNDTAPSSSSAKTQHLFDAKGASLFELQFVKVHSCDLISHMFSSNSMQSLQNLEDLIVEYCQSLRVLFDFEDLTKKNNTTEHFFSTLSCITNMELIGLPILEYIWKPHQKIQAFQSLRSVVIYQCDLLTNVFPCYIAEGLGELEYFSISDCPQMREIIYIDEECGDREFEASATKKIVFSRLKTLELKGLESLVSFVGANCVELPMLEDLELANLPSVKTWVTKHDVFHAMHIAGPTYQNLRKLNVSHCNSLKTLLWHSTAKCLERLEELSVCWCMNIDQIISKPAEGEESEINTNILPKLTLLTLTDLPNLTSFTEGKYIIDWQSLKNFKFWECPNMTTFCYESISTPNLSTGEFSDGEKPRQLKYKDLNTIVRFIFQDYASDVFIEPQIRGQWVA